MLVDQFKTASKKNWHLSDQFMNVLAQLSSYDTADHKWAVEIGDYDNDSEKFIIDNVTYRQQVSPEDWPRIMQERALYQVLVQIRPVPFTDFAANEQILANERATVLKQAARLAYFDFTEKEICDLLTVNRNYLKINRTEFKQWKDWYAQSYVKTN
ncbi:hypothetical protein JK197_14140 [Lactiplantibacillus plantarum]|uniref:hypothetical protein n=1 Tax=Lactiplantibacillus plantarum TaxID=1590 RepID=UPI001BABCD38|nr:hypothetical protein [Lactiplantibacillus plantarum]MBS0940873.1 hypothetical protein [Lactiplantibacillus plantarum]MCG0690849.1 hypothetical protein [Lactiplantibacillus plantarum]MCG0942114.1 hypothetical protein [Lactiplantibacillus plantarum]MCT3224236.1 hypothetical protein [Lactiplantibacillus plantarum]MCT3274702.1 hypothetical protein [Lactiplantibacillus plantarum]